MIVAGEYDSAEALVVAVGLARTTRVRVVETYTPRPLEEIEPPSDRVPIAPIAAAGGLAGVVGGYAGQWLVSAYLYPVSSGGRPPHMPLAFVPIALECGFLAAALAVVAAFVVKARMTALWRPIDEVPGFSAEGYWLVVAGEDEVSLRSFLAKTGATSVASVGEAA